jgi:predicted amidophosphoribosyltransferase
MWLIPDAPALDERIAESGWTPDAPGAWCDRCGSTVGPFEESEFGCAQCRGARPAWDRAVRLGEHSGELRQWIHEVKFTRFHALGTRLGRLLGTQLRLCGLAGDRVVICPMPTTWRRRTVRGIDHAGAIARGAALELSAPSRRLLTRRHRPSQQSLPASARRRNVSGAFARRDGVSIGRRHVVLIDDVTTTGSTAQAAARALRRGLRGEDRPESVWLAVLAVAPRPGTDENRTGGNPAKTPAKPAASDVGQNFPARDALTS